MTSTLVLLIVDDSARMRSTIRSILGQTVSDIIECENGLDALAAYEALRPDWVLMDISMPGLDGITATRRIHDFDNGARVVIVTDFADPTFKRAAELAGAVAYVTKDNLLTLLDIIQ